MADWDGRAAKAEERYRSGTERLAAAADPDSRQRQLTQLGNAANAVALCLLMARRPEQAVSWFTRAAERWRESFDGAPPGSWGRPVGVLKARVLAGDWEAATEAAAWVLGEDAARAASPIARYAACLALLVLGRDAEARPLADGLRTHDDFPAAVGDALATIAAEDPLGYIEAIEPVLESFTTREAYLEDIPVADTVLVLQQLAARRSLTAELDSPLLPAV